MPATGDATVTFVHPGCAAGTAWFAQTLTTAGLGICAGAVYRPLALIVPTVALPPVTSATVHVNGPRPPDVTENCWVAFRNTVGVVGSRTRGPTTDTDVVAVNDSIAAVMVA